MAGLDQAFEYINQFAERWMKSANIPGLAIAVTNREKTLHISTFGAADLAAQTPVSPDTLFEIGSLAKPFTSIPLLQLREEGKLDLGKPVADYLPWFRVQSEHPPITLHHLMNHTAGIVRGTDLAPHGLYEVWALRQTRTSAPPGEHFWYSNIGYKTLGFLLEAATGQSLQDVIQSRVLNPLGMTQTCPAITQETRKRTATGHTPFYDDRPDHSSYGLTPSIWTEFGTADGCLVSNVGDMATYLRMLLNRGRTSMGRLLSEESFDLMALNGVWTGGDYYGYGLATYNQEGRSYIGHGGGNAGFRSAIVVDLEAGLGVVFLLNLNGETDPIVAAAIHALTALGAAHRGEKLPPVPPSDDASSVPNAAEFAGTYRSGNRVLTLTPVKGRLQLEHDGQVIALERRTPDNFYVRHPDFDRFLLEFKRETGRVAEAWHGPDWYVGRHYSGPGSVDSPPEWKTYTGHYRGRNPELSNFRVFLRRGILTLVLPWGAVEPMQPLGDGRFHIGGDQLSPEILQFEAVVEGRALRADYSGCPYFRAFSS